MPSTCERCAELEKRISELKAEVLELEDRRSRERTRFLTLQQEQFLYSVDGPSDTVPKKDFCDLLELLERTVRDPSTESLEHVKSTLAKFMI